MKRAKFWFKNEKEVMRSLGFEPVKGSGSGWIHKEDGESDLALAQLKSTESESYKLNYLDIQKLEYHASVSHKIPVFVIEFLKRGTYVLINVNDFNRLKDLCIGEKEVSVPSVFIKEDQEELSSVTTTSSLIVSSNKGRKDFYKEREKQWKNKKRK